MSKHNKVEYLPVEEPKFITLFKKRAGYKEPDKVEDKFRACEKITENELGDKEDELPQVVIEEDSNITEAEAKKFLLDGVEDRKEAEKESFNRKITYVKPEKKLKRKSDDAESKASKVPKINNKKLLSFCDAEEEEEEEN